MSESDQSATERESYFGTLRRFFESEVRFNALLGMKVERLAPGEATLRIAYFDDLLGDPFRPALHGGVLSTLADTAGGVAAFTTVRPGDRLATVDLRVDYLRPAAPADLVAEGRVLRVGNRVAVCDIIVHQGDTDRPVATGKGVYNIKRFDGETTKP